MTVNIDQNSTDQRCLERQGYQQHRVALRAQLAVQLAIADGGIYSSKILQRFDATGVTGVVSAKLVEQYTELAEHFISVAEEIEEHEVAS